MSADDDDFLLDFASQGNAAQYCLTGWSTPEPAETWTLGGESRLALPAPRHRATYAMVFKLRPLVGGEIVAQRLRVVVNNVQVAEFTIDRRSIRTCLIPWAAIQLNPEVRVAFFTPDSARPADLGQGKDTRKLGVAFSSILFYPDRYEHGQYDAFLSQDEEVPVDIALVMQAEKLPLHDLMLQFESLGQNCEFGLVQRQCQAEPLGLLRFSSTPLPQLLDALEARFDGMGGAGTIHVDLSPNGREYMVRDSRFGFLYHAWVSAGETPPEDIARRELRRVPFRPQAGRRPGGRREDLRLQGHEGGAGGRSVPPGDGDPPLRAELAAVRHAVGRGAQGRHRGSPRAGLPGRIHRSVRPRRQRQRPVARAMGEAVPRGCTDCGWRPAPRRPRARHSARGQPPNTRAASAAARNR